jgi:protein gp37
MTTVSRIEWTERTWNPVVGCTKISPGCKHCYAETLSRRLRAIGVPGYEMPFTTVRVLPQRLLDPVRRRTPTLYFVNSMSDLFHEAVPESFIDRVFDVIRSTPQHTYQILTKRAERLSDYSYECEIPENAWVGVSVEDKKYGVPRIAHLQSTRAATRFLSIEPLLESIGSVDMRDIDWAIVGGESGHKARPMAESWVQEIRTQCANQGVLFFFKQWGAFGADGIKRSKKKNGRLLDGVEWNDMPTLATV